MLLPITRLIRWNVSRTLASGKVSKLRRMKLFPSVVPFNFNAADIPALNELLSGDAVRFPSSLSIHGEPDHTDDTADRRAVVASPVQLPAGMARPERLTGLDAALYRGLDLGLRRTYAPPAALSKRALRQLALAFAQAEAVKPAGTGLITPAECMVGLKRIDAFADSVWTTHAAALAEWLKTPAGAAALIGTDETEDAEPEA
jgi:hypothetical protein